MGFGLGLAFAPAGTGLPQRFGGGADVGALGMLPALLLDGSKGAPSARCRFAGPADAEAAVSIPLPAAEPVLNAGSPAVPASWPPASIMLAASSEKAKGTCCRTARWTCHTYLLPFRSK
jgi:hypothetical protein